MMRRQQQQDPRDYYSKVLYELSDLVLNIMRSPVPSMEFSDQQTPAIQRRASLQQITPAGFASMLLGISLALMLCGSLTFFIGFILMPWVLGLVVFLYFVGLVSSVTMIWRALFSHNSAPPSPRKDAPSWKFL